MSEFFTVAPLIYFEGAESRTLHDGTGRVKGLKINPPVKGKGKFNLYVNVMVLNREFLINIIQDNRVLHDAPFSDFDASEENTVFHSPLNFTAVGDE